MEHLEQRIIIEHSVHIVDLLSKILTLSNVVDQITEDRNMEDNIAINPIEDEGYDTIELREMVTGLEDVTLDVKFLNCICTAVINSATDGIKRYSEINTIKSLLSNGINEVLLFQIILDENYEQDSLSFRNELKNSIEDLFTNAVNDITNQLIDNRILEKYTYVDYLQYMPGGIVLFCSNKKLKVLEER